MRPLNLLVLVSTLAIAGGTTPANSAQRYRDAVCSAVYDPAEGDPGSGIPAGTAFEDLPANWTNECGANKADHEPLNEEGETAEMDTSEAQDVAADEVAEGDELEDDEQADEEPVEADVDEEYEESGEDE